jgi:hypothetical protein
LRMDGDISGWWYRAFPNFIASYMASAAISFVDMSWPMMSVKSSLSSWYFAERELLSWLGVVVVGAGG